MREQRKRRIPGPKKANQLGWHPCCRSPRTETTGKAARGSASDCAGYNSTTHPEAGAAVLASWVPVHLLRPPETDQIPFDAVLPAMNIDP
jgi:hypothetical protein